jgi:hypothetical protein
MSVNILSFVSPCNVLQELFEAIFVEHVNGTETVKEIY